MTKHNKNIIMDDDGVQIGVELNNNRVAEKRFSLSSKDANWPTDADGKPVSLDFTLLCDMNGVTYNTLLDDAIRTKVIRLQNALRKGFSFEALSELSKQPLKRPYAEVAVLSDAPEKALSKVQTAIANMSPEQLATIKAQIEAQLN